MAGDPRPVGLLLRAQAFVGAGLVAWWFLQPAARRLTRLIEIARVEQATTVPPMAVDGVQSRLFLEQVTWLARHRVEAFTEMAGFVVLATVIGLAEGHRRRQRDQLKGFRLSLWTVGVVAGMGLPGVLGCALVLPWPLRFSWVAYGLAALVAAIGYILGRGRPSIP